MENKRFAIYAILPDGEEIQIRESVSRTEAERLAAIVVKVATAFYGHAPRYEKGMWYVVSWDIHAHEQKLCWIVENTTDHIDNSDEGTDS